MPDKTEHRMRATQYHQPTHRVSYAEKLKDPRWQKHSTNDYTIQPFKDWIDGVGGTPSSGGTDTDP
jgi:hypothetical protein